MRDVFIDTIFEYARQDKNVCFLSADLGAQALDRFRIELPGQFIHVGISEQNMIDLAAGLSLSGKKVFVYAMAPFITARCYEQIKCSLAAMKCPVTLVSVGVGLGYDHATITHFTTEDIACMRALNGIEILSPCDVESTLAIAKLCLQNPKLRYVRLERPALPELYEGRFSHCATAGMGEIARGNHGVIITSGYLVQKALEIRNKLREISYNIGVIDLFRVKPIDKSVLNDILMNYGAIFTYEEQMLDGGFGSAVLECANDIGITTPIRRFGIHDGFVVQNGDRDELHELYKIDQKSIVERIKGVLHEQI